jgi:hypothetical protein
LHLCDARSDPLEAYKNFLLDLCGGGDVDLRGGFISITKSRYLNEGATKTVSRSAPEYFRLSKALITDCGNSFVLAEVSLVGERKDGNAVGSASAC